MTSLRCWQCEVEPEELFDVTSMADPEPVYLPLWPPPTDHEHAGRPPTPGEITAEAYRARERMLRTWMR